MSIRDLIPFNWRREHDLPVRRVTPEREWPATPFGSDIDRLFESFFGDFPAPWGESSLVPRVNIRETDKNYIVEAEIPGLDEKDLEVVVDRGMLVLRGEKRHERRDEKDGHVRRFECAYGHIERRLPLPDDVIADQAKATYRNGVVTITLARDGSKPAGKRIPVTVD